MCNLTRGDIHIYCILHNTYAQRVKKNVFTRDFPLLVFYIL